MKRRAKWAMFCMAVWLSGTVFSAVVATQNFYTIDRLLKESENEVFNTAVRSMENPSARDMLRYLSSELNRLYFQYWSIVQLPVGILALWLVRPLPVSQAATWAIAAMLLASLFLMAIVTPQIVSIGRALDFVPRDPSPPQMGTFGLLHAAYSIFTLVNIALGILATLLIQKDEPNQDS